MARLAVLLVLVVVASINAKSIAVGGGASEVTVDHGKASANNDGYAAQNGKDLYATGSSDNNVRGHNGQINSVAAAGAEQDNHHRDTQAVAGGASSGSVQHGSMSSQNEGTVNIGGGSSNAAGSSNVEGQGKGVDASSGAVAAVASKKSQSVAAGGAVSEGSADHGKVVLNNNGEAAQNGKDLYANGNSNNRAQGNDPQVSSIAGAGAGQDNHHGDTQAVAIGAGSASADHGKVANSDSGTVNIDRNNANAAASSHAAGKGKDVDASSGAVAAVAKKSHRAQTAQAVAVSSGSADHGVVGLNNQAYAGNHRGNQYAAAQSQAYGRGKGIQLHSGAAAAVQRG